MTTRPTSHCRFISSSLWSSVTFRPRDRQATVRLIIISSRRRLPTDIQSRSRDDKTRQRDTWRLQVRLAYCRQQRAHTHGIFNGGDSGWKTSEKEREERNKMMQSTPAFKFSFHAALIATGNQLRLSGCRKASRSASYSASCSCAVSIATVQAQIGSQFLSLCVRTLPRCNDRTRMVRTIAGTLLNNVKKVVDAPFLPRDAMLAQYMLWPRVCLSVCHNWVFYQTTKRKQRRTISQGLCFLLPKILMKIEWDHPN